MKIIYLFLVLILIFGLTACVATTPTPKYASELSVSDESANRINADQGLDTRVKAIENAKLATREEVNSQNQAAIKRIEAMEAKPVIDSAQTEMILKRLAEQDKKDAELQKQYEALRAEIEAYKTVVTATPTPTPVGTGTLIASLIKNSDYVTSLTMDEQEVDFSIKLTNNTGVYLKNIRLGATIYCNRTLSLVAEPYMRDSSNGALIYDVINYDDSNMVDFEFTRSTGCPYVYLNAGESLIIKPVLVFQSDTDANVRYTFTINISELTWEKG